MTDRANCNFCGALQPATALTDKGCAVCTSPTKNLTAIAQNREAANQVRVFKNSQKERAALAQKNQVKSAEMARKIKAGQELARRELARRKYLPFVLRTHPTYDAGWFHKDLCLRLEKFSEAVAREESPRLALFVPPRHGKSLTSSKTFPSWHLGKYPTHEFICCSYSASLANDFSRANRAILRDPDYGLIFDTRLDKDTQAVEHWATTEGGGFSAAGVGGPITGKGAHILLIDDPVKNRDEAESFSIRESIKNWYTSTAYTRLAPGGGVLLIQTRWHDDDLGGWQISEMEDGKDQWEVVTYPALAKENEKYRYKGEALHPARYDKKSLEKIRTAIGPRDFESLYQQNPVADDGALFGTQDFRLYKPEDLPNRKDMVFFTAWDFAIGQKQYNDYTVGITVGIDQDENIWVVDVARGRWDSMQIVDEILEMQRRWGSTLTGMEKGQIHQSIGPFIRKRIKETRSYTLNIQELQPGRTDKVARSQSILGRARQGKLYVPALASWAQDLLNECLRFPAGVNDDIVDTLAWIGILMDRFFTVYKPKPPKKKKKSWKDKLDKYVNRTGASTNPMTS